MDEDAINLIVLAYRELRERCHGELRLTRLEIEAINTELHAHLTVLDNALAGKVLSPPDVTPGILINPITATVALSRKASSITAALKALAVARAITGATCTVTA